MKCLEFLGLDRDILSQNLDELEALLSGGSALKEAEHILPFFKARPHLVAGIGLTTYGIDLPDLYASELDLFGDFAADAAVAESQSNTCTLIEFEDARENSIFKPLTSGKTMRPWSPRFERGFSQLADWAWRLATETHHSEAFVRIFGQPQPTLDFLLIIGRDHDLTLADLKRLKWRADRITLDHHRMRVMTFDGVLKSIRRKLVVADQLQPADNPSSS